MGKTYRKRPKHCLRRPRGYRQAASTGARLKAIPPSDREDIIVGSECFIPNRAASRMADQGLGVEEIAKKISTKFHCSSHDALDLAATMFD